MAINLIEMLSSQMGGSVLSQASQFLGESESSTKTAMGAALPAILGSVIQKGSTQSGAQGVMDMITNGGFNGNMLNNIGSMFGGGDASANMMNQGNGILNSLMGNNMGSVINMISKVSGMGSKSSSSLMGMLAPMVMSGIAKQVMGKGVSGLMSFLSSQSGFVKDAAPAEMSSLMGFANMGKDMASKTMSTATNVVTDTAEAGGGLMKKLLPLGLLALLALGVFWFFKGGSVADAASTMTETVGDAAGAVTDAAGNAAGAVTDAAGNVVDGAVDAAGNAAGAVTDAAGNVVDAAGNAVDAAGNAVGNAAAATMAAATEALKGVKFAAGSVGEKFTNFLSSGADGNGEAFVFSNLNFKVGSADIAGEDLSELDNLAKALNAYSNVHVEVGGHTDNTGNADKNMSLSASRAASVKAYLVKQGVDAARITTKGYGDTAPIADNATAEGKQKNRRTEVRITKR